MPYFYAFFLNEQYNFVSPDDQKRSNNSLFLLLYSLETFRTTGRSY